jgi:hypothetical protein
MKQDGRTKRWWLQSEHSSARCQAMRGESNYPGQCKNHAVYEGLCKSHYRVAREGRNLKRIAS